MTTTLTDIGTLIEVTPGICGGRPRIAGTGVSIRRITGWYKMGRTSEEIVDQYGHLNLAQVHAALTYYHANRETIDVELAEEEAGNMIGLRGQRVSADAADSPLF